MMDVSLDGPAPRPAAGIAPARRPLIVTTLVLRAALVATLLATVAAAGRASAGDRIADSRATPYLTATFTQSGPKNLAASRQVASSPLTMIVGTSKWPAMIAH